MGFSVLPEGNILDDDYIRMKYFLGFLQGERQGAVEMMRKRGS